MNQIVVSVLLMALILGAVYGAAAAISIGGIDRLDGGDVAVSTIQAGANCGTGTGMVASDVTCSTTP